MAAMPIDWPRLLEDLAHLLGEPGAGNPDVRTPCGSRELASQLCVARSTLRGWMDGGEPRYSDGEMLLMRWHSLTLKPLEFAPRQRASLSAARV